MMMGLRDIESRLPPGFRFHPSDAELLSYYLRTKVTNQTTSQQLIVSAPPPAATMVEVDLHEREPWELPVAAKFGDNEWYFFSFRDRKYATGSRMNRATKLGYWKATGKDKMIHDQEPPAGMLGGRDAVVIGMRKTLVFYFGRAPNGRKSSWVMHEFRLATSDNPPPPKEDWVLCRVFHKVKGGDEQQAGSCSTICNSTIGPGASWPAGLCSPPPQQPPNNNLFDEHHQLFQMIVSSPFTNNQLLDATPLVATLLHSQDMSRFEFFSDLASASAGETGLAGCGRNGRTEMETEMVLLQDGSNDGDYFFRERA